MVSQGHLLARFLLALALLVPVCAGAQEQPPRIGSSAYAREHGPRLLIEQDWESASEAFGICQEDLWEALPEVWSAHRDRPQIEQDRYHYRLLHFLVRQGDFLRIVYVGIANPWDQIADGYPRWSRAVSEEERLTPLDFSHLDLLEWAKLQERTETRVTEEDCDRVLSALHQSPESIPALAALCHCLESIDCWDESEGDPAAPLIREAEGILTGPVGRLALARFLIQHYILSDNDGLLEQILRAALPLVPSREEKARFLHEISQCQDELDETIPILREVYESYPETNYAKRARFDAIKAILKLDRLEDAHREVIRLRSIEEAQRRGLEECMVRVGRTYIEAGEYEKAEPLLLDVVEQWPGSPQYVAYAMQSLAVIARSRGKEDQEMEWLVKAQKARPGIWAVAERLAEIHGSRGDWEEAIRAWERLDLGGIFCANCAQGAWLGRQEAIARCQVELGRYRPLVELHVRTLADPHPLSKPDFMKMALELYDLYRQAEQTDDLRRILETIEKKRRPYIERIGKHRGYSPEKIQAESEVPTIRELLRLRDLGTRKEVEVLIDYCRDKEPVPDDDKWFRDPEPFHLEAARALARCGDASLQAMAKVLESGGDDLDWLLHALSIHPNVEEATAVLRGIASDLDNDCWLAASLTLREMEKKGRPGDPEPSPIPGSLPKEVDLD